MLPDTPQAAFNPEPDARSGLSLACNNHSLRSNHSKVNVPGLLLRFLARHFLRPFDLLARPPIPVRPGYRPLQCLRSVAESMTRLAGCAACLHSPFGVLPPSGSKRSTGIATCRLAFRTRPISHRSPRPISITSNTGYGSTFRVRYVSGDLLFLKPLGTFPTMPESTQSVNAFVIEISQFPQQIFILFRMSYRP
jgi:hypothetical protein